MAATIWFKMHSPKRTGIYELISATGLKEYTAGTDTIFATDCKLAER